MASDKLQIHRRVKLKDGQLLMGFSGWMDGGNISTGTVKFLVEQLDAQKLALLISSRKDFTSIIFPVRWNLRPCFGRTRG
ncbi:MAG: hypothetical protein ACYS6I_06140 [Planctomycetota bacterium]|jgi:hypothetical protein